MVLEHSCKRFPTRSRRHRAVTLIEAVLYISIALALIVGGLVFYQQASTAARTSAFVRQMSALIQEAATIYYDPAYTPTTSFGYYGSNVSRVGHIIAAQGGAPSDYIRPGTFTGNAAMGVLQTSFVNPWGGATEVFVYAFQPLGLPRTPMVSILSVGVPDSVCTRIVANRGTGFAGTGIRSGILHDNYAYFSVTANGSVLPNGYILPATVSQAGAFCRNGTFGPAPTAEADRVLWMGFNIGA